MIVILSILFLLVLTNQVQADETNSVQASNSKNIQKNVHHNNHNQPNHNNHPAHHGNTSVLNNDNQCNLPGGCVNPVTPFQFPVFETVELTEDNHVVLKGEINEESISKAIVDISNIADSDEIILFICSPGGSVLAGNNFIQFMNFLRQKGKTFTCVADQAASMAFGIFQACDNRYVTPSSILMQHQMSVGLQDQYENLKNRITLLDAINQQAIATQAHRIGLTVEEFKKKVISDWWLYGQDGVSQNAADKVIQVGCSQELLEGTTEEIIEFFGATFKVVFSKCPLARAPLSFTEAKGHDTRHESSHVNSTIDVQKAFYEYLQTQFLTNTTIRHFL